MNAGRKQQGFTIIEVMITMAVIALLVAVALPSYNSATRKSNRANAQATLVNIASRQQQMLLDTRAYAASVAALNLTLPSNVSPHYSVSITLGTDTVPTFTATATPIGSQTKDTQCPQLSIDQNGRKLPANCW